MILLGIVVICLGIFNWLIALGVLSGELTTLFTLTSNILTPIAAGLALLRSIEYKDEI